MIYNDINEKQKLNDLYWLSFADKVAEKSKCHKRKIGSVLLDVYGRVVTTAYNGHPRRSVCDHECLRKDIPTHTNMSIGYCTHSEINTLIFANFRDMQEGTLYISAPPCEGCAPYLLQAGLGSLVYFKDGYPENGVELIKKLQNSLIGFSIRSYDREENK